MKTLRSPKELRLSKERQIAVVMGIRRNRALGEISSTPPQIVAAITSLMSRRPPCASDCRHRPLKRSASRDSVRLVWSVRKGIWNRHLARLQLREFGGRSSSSLYRSAILDPLDDCISAFDDTDYALILDHDSVA